jgi:hypothetical protein
MFPRELRPELKELRDWLDQWSFSRFVTLATNHIGNGSQNALLSKLKQWDARMNRALEGRDWAKRPEDRFWAFYFLEKPIANPHWHGLVRLFSIDDDHRKQQEEIFDERASLYWERLSPGGTAKVKTNYSQEILAGPHQVVRVQC